MTDRLTRAELVSHIAQMFHTMKIMRRDMLILMANSSGTAMLSAGNFSPISPTTPSLPPVFPVSRSASMANLGPGLDDVPLTVSHSASAAILSQDVKDSQSIPQRARLALQQQQQQQQLRPRSRSASRAASTARVRQVECVCCCLEPFFCCAIVFFGKKKCLILPRCSRFFFLKQRANFFCIFFLFSHPRRPAMFVSRRASRRCCR